ncbi:rhizopuspepsin 6 precursor [Rhizopus microsporus var. microsporus]|uniref:rhizopuspepsin n=2 Tax=Rhizopus microsporus TaxID=58291 RepID=A0A2G4T3H9_RHIZD|nr:rhizopuspepsin 6 precursor [Rhizopus microsporus ATCC 52813]ORE02091.1 rhizopuspepsin 6 precursor [Rhizopus microsporus var. microsporus]PHZ15570.1 rhizopuspepsin 6 precursor [Rhizopus microsporus ATCC 52813]
MKFTLTSCIALALVALTAEAAPEGKKINIPLEVNEDYKPNAKAALEKVIAKYSRFGFTTESNGISPQSINGTVPVVDDGNDLRYYGIVKVGTPGVDLRLDFDTGSSDLWFASTLCTNCGSSQRRYDPSKSKTYKKDGRKWSIRYGDGSSSNGILGKDTVNLGGLAIKQQTIGIAQRESLKFASGTVDGLLGLGFSSLSSVEGVKTPVDNLINHNLISSPIFSVFLGKASKGGGGEYIFGGYDSTKFKGKLTTVPVDNSIGFWGIDVNNTRVGDKITSDPFKAIIDTGTTLLVLPSDVSTPISHAYNATDNFDGTYTINCDTSNFKPLTFSIGGADFEVPPDSLIFEKKDDKCMASFTLGNVRGLAILGDTFLKNNYVVFNQKVPEVQIARSINT